MTEAVIVAAARTPVGRARKGSLVDVDAFRLAEIAVGEAVSRSGIDTADIDDIVLGESLYGGGDIARHTAVVLGLDNVAGIADNRHCASGLSARATRGREHPCRHGHRRRGRWHAQLELDAAVVAGAQPGGEPQMWMSPSHPDTPDAPAFDMSITVGENTAREVGISRHDVDEWAAYSHGQAIASIDSGAFEEEIVPVEYVDREGIARTFSVDEHPRRGVTVESLAELKPIHPELDSPTVTAGNTSGINDAAAALVLTSDDYAEAHGAASAGARRVVGERGHRARAHRHGPHASRSPKRSSAPASPSTTST